MDSESGAFFFLEMNTRLQVEHPVTEMITGLDIVGLQLELAAGRTPAGLADREPAGSGHAIECRIYAENPARRFLPSPGVLSRFDLPALHRDLRIDTGYAAGDEVSRWYDPLVAKLVVLADDRGRALERMADALRAVRIEGIATNVSFLSRVLGDQEFRAGPVDTGYVDRALPRLLEQNARPSTSARAAPAPSGRRPPGSG